MEILILRGHFFEQFADLMAKVPRIGMDLVNCENSDYCNYCGDNKNCYLDIAGEGNEDCFFNLFTKHSTDVMDSTFAYNSELVYESISCYECYNIRSSMYMESCSDCSFCFDLKGCKDCLFSSNLRQKQYCIYNKQYSKTKYEEYLKSLNLDTYNGQMQALADWHKLIQGSKHKYAQIISSENCTGDNIKNSKNTHESFNVSNCEDVKYCYDALDAKDCQDINYSLYNPESSYELISTLNMQFSAFCMASHYCSSTFYSDQCNNSSDLFACIGIETEKILHLEQAVQQGRL